MKLRTRIRRALWRLETLTVAGLGAITAAAFLIPHDRNIAGYFMLGVAALLLEWRLDR
jgi:hypothetical protein